MMEYLSIHAFADKWNISKRRIQILCREGRINGAKRIGNMWVIPENAVRPVDARTKNPVIISSKTEESDVRRGLKKLLKQLFQRTAESGIPEKEKKTIVLSIIACSLCAYYLKEKEISPDIKEKICKDISGKENIVLSEEDLKEAYDFIEKYKNEQELDNLLSWAYQYTNKLVEGNIYSQTQFFTEKYMIDYLVAHISGLQNANKIVDPCVGGGNFLVECLNFMCEQCEETGSNLVPRVLSNAAKLYGYDIDCDITRVALVNIKLSVLAILNRKDTKVSFELWDKICPNIFRSSFSNDICGSLSIDNRTVINVQSGVETGINLALGEADVVLTNPPFATIKGMLSEQKDFLKKNYPDVNCDMCVAFIDAVYAMLKPSGICGIVSQNSWMHLK